MSEATNEGQIKSYLLGGLSEEESEAFEERFFADNELFSDIQIVEMGLIDSYIRNEMSFDERKGFEANFLITPERRAKVAEARLFHDELETSRPAARVAEEKVGWLERLFGVARFSMPVMQYAGAGLIVILGLSTGWLIYDGWRTKQDLLVARNSLTNSENALNDQLAAKERELQDKLARQRGEDSETLAALQDEINSLQHQLDEARRKSETVNPPNTPQRLPAIATIILVPGRGGVNIPANVAIAKETKVLNIRLPVGISDGDKFEVTISRGGETLLKSDGVKPLEVPGGRTISLSVPAKRLTEGTYNVILRGQSGKEITRSFAVRLR